MSCLEWVLVCYNFFKDAHDWVNENNTKKKTVKMFSFKSMEPLCSPNKLSTHSMLN